MIKSSFLGQGQDKLGATDSTALGLALFPLTYVLLRSLGLVLPVFEGHKNKQIMQMLSGGGNVSGVMHLEGPC